MNNVPQEMRRVLISPKRLYHILSPWMMGFALVRFAVFVSVFINTLV